MNKNNYGSFAPMVKYENLIEFPAGGSKMRSKATFIHLM